MPRPIAVTMLVTALVGTAGATAYAASAVPDTHVGPPSASPAGRLAPSKRPPVRTPRPRPKRWVPGQGLDWQVQYEGAVAANEPAEVVNVDGEATTARQVAAWHRQGKKAVCYINAGAWESWRSDAHTFPASVRGEGLVEWEGEHWLDVRRRSVLLPIMAKRMDMCRAKGFDAVDADNVDGSSNDTGFAITEDDQVAYDRALADLAHRRGMSISLKNAVELLPRLGGVVDFAVNEQCREYDECDAYAAFTRTGKAVVDIEYTSARPAVCSAVPRGFTRIVKRESLDAWTVRC